MKSAGGAATLEAVNRLIQSRYAMAAGAGLLLAASFPKVGIAGFGWVAPGLILAAGLGLPPAERFRVGFVGGLAHYLTSLYWLLLIPYQWHGVPLAPITGWLALSAFMSLYMAIWVWLAGGMGTAATPGEGAGLRGPLFLLARSSWVQRARWAFFAAVAWVALEMMIARFLSGFPWNLLGSSQFRLVPLIQIASVAGVYGVSFLLVWSSVALLCAVSRVIHTPGGKAAWAADMALPMLAVALAFGGGYRNILQAGPPQPARNPLRLALVQPSIPQTLIWEPTNDDLRFQELLALSARALETPADLLIWPEAAVPKLLRYDQDTFDAVTSFARRHKVWMIIGADDAEPRRERNPATGKQEADYYNSSFLISPEGRVAESYKKRALVIFGEYVPLSNWLGFLKLFTPMEDGFTPGKRPVPFRMADPAVEVSVLICFEDVFPHLAREYVTDDTDFLVNLTNNGWFGEGAAQWQHAASALFRAVENGRSLIRCSNNGLTCWVDRHGRLREVFRDPQGSVYGKGFLRVDIPMRDRPPVATFYNRHGDVFGWVCVGVALLALLTRLPRLRKRPQAGLAPR